MRTTWAFLSICLAQPLTAVSAPDPFKCFVSGRRVEVLGKDEQKAREQQAKEKASGAEKDAEALGKTLEAQHGKSRADWPAAVRDQYELADRALITAVFDRDLADADQKRIDEGVGHLKKILQGIADKDGQGRVALAGSREEASIAIEVLACQRSGRAAAIDLEVTPVNWRPAQGMPELPIRSAATLGDSALVQVRPVHAYSEATPRWVLAVWFIAAPGGSCEGAARMAAELLVEMSTGHLAFFNHRDPKPETP